MIFVFSIFHFFLTLEGVPKSRKKPSLGTHVSKLSPQTSQRSPLRPAPFRVLEGTTTPMLAAHPVCNILCDFSVLQSLSLPHKINWLVLVLVDCASLCQCNAFEFISSAGYYRSDCSLPRSLRASILLVNSSRLAQTPNRASA